MNFIQTAQVHGISNEASLDGMGARWRHAKWTSFAPKPTAVDCDALPKGGNVHSRYSFRVVHGCYGTQHVYYLDYSVGTGYTVKNSVSSRTSRAVLDKEQYYSTIQKKKKKLFQRLSPQRRAA